MSSWKSWYTTLIEFVVVLAWTLCFMEWLESRKRGCWIASAALAVVGLLSRELAPPMIAAAAPATVVLLAFGAPGFGRKRAIRRLVAWALSPQWRLHPAVAPKQCEIAFCGEGDIGCDERRWR